MKTATAEDIRTLPIYVTLPHSEFRIECRRPDALELIAQGALPLDVYGEALERMQAFVESEGLVIDNRPIDAEAQLDYVRLVNLWACAAAVAPRVVLTEDEALADPSVVWVQDLALEVRVNIVRATRRGLASPRLKTAVAEFRRQRSAGDQAGPGSAAVRDAAVGAAAGA